MKVPLHRLLSVRLNLVVLRIKSNLLYFMLKKYFIFFLLVFNLLSAPTVYVYAQTDLYQDIAKKSGYAAADSFSLSQTVGRLIKIVIGLVGTIFLALTVYAGFLWMTAAGEESKVEKAMGILKTSIIGLIIILAAYSITYFVMNSLVQATF